MDSTKHGLIIDLNKYRPGRDLKKFLDAGADGFILRIGGPSQWVEGDYKYEEDPTWRPYMDQAAKLGIAHMIGGYIVHNPFEDWHLQGIISNVHLNLLNQWTSGGYMPAYFVIDHEINYCYRGATKIIVTPYNLVESLKSVTDQIYKQWRKMVMIYTGRWFIDQNGPADHITYLDNINKPESAGGVGTQRPMWYAGYRTYTKEYTDLKQAVEELPSPTGDYIGKVLQCGSYSLATAWQFTSSLKLAGDVANPQGVVTGVDASVTWGTLQQYWDAVGVKTTTPPEPPEEPPADDDLAARVNTLEVEIAALQQDMAEMKTFKANVKAA